MTAVPKDQAGRGTLKYYYSTNSIRNNFLLKAVMEEENSALLISEIDGIQAQFSNIDCEDTAYCIKI